MAMNRMTRGNLQFILGLVLGITASFMLTSYRQMTQSSVMVHLDSREHKSNQDLQRVLLPDAHDLDEHAFHEMMEKNQDIPLVGGGEAKAVKFEDEHAHHDDDTAARDLAKKVRVLVWVMTGPQNLDKKAVHVRNTWGKRVNKLLFMSSQWNSTFPTIGLNVSEGREHLTAKTMQAFRYVYEKHFDEADWFMKADDDTYLIAENLRYMLSSYDTNQPVYFGHIFKVIVKPDGYASGGAGYILSKEALRRLATQGHNTSMCRQDGGAEDVEVGKCMTRMGIKILPSVDRLGRSRFHCFGPETHLQGGYPKWYLSYDANGAKKGLDNISDYPITFHYINTAKMYALEYFVYHVRPFGIISKPQDLNLDLKH
ncbi:glycoprotein-N-acetylgalactosamine 3-beta-galactosyltransferase 1-like [Littorina saxatilis]|uniref:glycoprotein-N-acetylgalactosamine 3-beta-galactosyltransferase 1-like n=1 Tax=Littorina saxatilis TaxID=31220 RepID=UPI0038B525E9